MIAAILRGFNQLELDEIPTPTPGPGQALIRIRAAIGSGVTNVREGDEVVIQPSGYCGLCPNDHLSTCLWRKLCRELCRS